ncbi:MAG: IS1096 element passenger TnpR family protein [Bacteroidota bacterium]
MLFKFRIINDEEREFVRDIEISGSSTFLDFHEVIQKELRYDSSQLASFFLTDEGWEKELEITLIDMMNDGDQPTLVMKDAVIGDYLSSAGERMLYVFDFFSERAFFIECMETGTEKPGLVYPRVAFRTGEPPVQIQMDIDQAPGEEEETYLNDLFNNEEIDDELLNEEGFDEFYPEE